MEFSAFVEAWLKNGLEKDGTLASGATEELVRNYRQGLRGSSPSVPGFVEHVVGLLVTDGPARLAFLNPARPLPASGDHPFKAETDLLAPILSSSGRAGLAARFATEVGGMAYRERANGNGVERRPGAMAARVVAVALSERSDNRYLAESIRPEIPAWEREVAGIVRELKRRGIVRSDVDPDALAATPDWASLGHNRDRRATVKTILTRLAKSYQDLAAPGVAPVLDPEDPLFGERTTPERTPEDLRGELARSGLYQF